MGLENALYQPFKILDKREHQNHRRRWVNGDFRSFRQIVTESRLPPFQIKRVNSNFKFTAINLFDVKTDSLVLDITNLINPEDLYVKRFAGFDQMIHLGQSNLSADLPKGVFYLEIVSGSLKWYSEVFTVLSLNEDDLSLNDCNFLKLTWGNSCDIAGFYYSDPDADFNHKLILEADLSPSEWLTTSAGSEDGEGVFYPDYQRAAKEWRFEVFAPEYIVDAIALLPLHNAVFIETYDGYRAKMENIGYAPDADVIDGFRKVVVSFTVDFFISVGCCDNLQPFDNCFIGTETVVAYITEDSADFTAFTFTNNQSESVPMEAGQIFMIGFNNGSFLKRRFNGTELVPVIEIPANNSTVNALNGEAYFYRTNNGGGSYYWNDRPVIDLIEYSPLKVYGQSFPLTGVELWLRSGGSGPGVFYRYATAEDFLTNGISFDVQNYGYNQVKIKATGLDCVLSETDWLSLIGVSFMQIENDFVIS